MSTLTETLSQLETQPPQARYEYLLETVIEQQEIWILVGETGSVLLSNEGDECVPVWPNKEATLDWIKEDWADCEPHSIPLVDWQARWTKGLREDGFDVAVYPNQQEEAIVVSSEDFDDDIIAAMSS